MVVPALGIDVGFHSFGKILNADLIRLRCLLTPVPCSGFAHEIHINKDIDYRILYEVELMTVLHPGFSVFIVKRLFEFLHASSFRELLLEVRQMRERAAIALHFIEYAQEYIDDGILILLAAGITLGVDIEQHDIRWCLRCQLHIRQHHRIGDLLIVRKEI